MGLMSTPRTVCVFATALILALSASATYAATTPAPIPTVSECNPSAQDCPVGKQCNCCCGTWVCMPPYLPCCALPCSEPTQLPTPTPTSSTTPTCPPLPPFQCLPDYEKVCEFDGECTVCRCVPQMTPTATPTRGECNPLAPDCPSETTCGCCCGTWECLPPDAICCEIACAFPTSPPAPTPTFTPITGECGAVCDGRPCTGFLIRSGTCQPDGDQCTCVPNTPAPGECDLACDRRPCVGQCPDGSTAAGFCTYLTIDTGCACALTCSMPTPTPTPTAPCTSVPCSGSCAVCPPCTPGTVCPNYCELGTCEMVSGSCACVPGISTPTPTPAVLPCVGDCNGDSLVTVDEIVRMVNIALNGEPSPNTCRGSDQWCNSGPVVGAIGITCLIDAVNDALYGCPVPPTPTPMPSLALSVHMARNPATQTLGLPENSI
jgi:hypothetical protein